MSFSLVTFFGDAEDAVEHDFLGGLNLEAMSEREKEAITQISELAKEIGQVLGGHVSISAFGHLNPSPQVGDNVRIELNAVPKPEAAAVVETPADPVPSAVPVDTVPATSPTPLADSPLESAQPGGSTAPVADAGLTQPPPVADPAPAVTSSGPDLGPGAVEAPLPGNEPAVDITPGPLTDPGTVPGSASNIDVPVTPAVPTADPAAGNPPADPGAAVPQDPALVDPTPPVAETASAPDPAWSDPAAPTATAPVVPPVVDAPAASTLSPAEAAPVVPDVPAQ
jgi:hypothetical protein